MAQRHDGNVTMCPTCESTLQLGGNLRIGQKLSCRRCGSTLAVFNRKPLELVLADENHPGDGREKVYKNLKKNMSAGEHTKSQTAKKLKPDWAFLDDDLED